MSCSTDDAPVCAPLEGTLQLERWRLDQRCSRGLCMNVLDARLGFEVDGASDETDIAARVSLLAEDTWQVDETCEGPL